NQDTELPQAAWEFVKCMNVEGGQKVTAMEGGSAPTRADLYEDEEVQEGGVLFSDPDFVDVLENAIPRPVSSIYPKISDILQSELSKVLTGDISAEESAKNMQEKMEEALDE